MDTEHCSESVGQSDAMRVLTAAERLQLESRGQRWAHLSLCVLDAVFSINARYSSAQEVPKRYAQHARLDTCLMPAASFQRSRPGEQPLSEFVADARRCGDELFASDVLQNRQRTSARATAPRKAQAARQVAEVLIAHGLETLSDVEDRLTDLAAIAVVEQDLAKVPGHGTSSIRVNYLWMLAGDDHRIKPDRMVLRWLRAQLQRTVSVAEATTLVRGAAASLGRTPWELDHGIWRAERRRPRPGSASPTC